jgi:hypothetical protein
MQKNCTACYEAGNEPEDATHTFYDPHNTMLWLCDEHAEEILEDASTNPENWVGSKLLPSVEESDPERHARYKRSNLLRFPLKSVA